MAKPSFYLMGGDLVKVRLQALAVRFPEIALEVALEEGDRIMTRSKEEFVPVEEGELRDSGEVHGWIGQGRDALGRFTAKGVQVELSYNTPYALAVHEHMSEHSPYSWTNAKHEVHFNPSGHGPKFLERPLMEAAANMNSRMAVKIRALLG